MKAPLRLIAILLSWLLLSATSVWAQNEGSAFSCDGVFYQIRQVNNTSSMFRVDRSSTAYTTVPFNIRTLANNTRTNDLGVLLNGLAYNSQDGYMYALSTNGNGNTLPNSVQMYKIGSGGIQLLGTVTGMPNIQVASGTIDRNGNYYISSQNTAGTANYNIYRFNLGASTVAGRLAATALRLYNAGNTTTSNLTFYDLAVNPLDNQLYGVFQTGTLWKIDVTSTANRALVTVIKNTTLNTDAAGTAFFDVAGNFFVYTNGTVGTGGSGVFYQVNLENGAYTNISTIDPASVSDGASCVNPDQSIDVVKEVVSVNRTTTQAGNDGREFNITFRLRLKNTSTATDNNVQVNDFLWSGISGGVRANTTFSTTTNRVPSAVTLVGSPTVVADPTNVNPVFSLAINPNYTGVGGPAPSTAGSLLTGTQPLTAGQAATITFTVRVTYAATTNVPARITNEAYASSSTLANPVGYRQNTSSGFISPPDQLLASDRSTDGPSLPLTPNGDTPIPSPIFFSTTISGTVFEDINYGGGAGRSQVTSKGIGVEGARVELYGPLSSGGPNATNPFLGFTTTDAAGNYAFSTTNGTTPLSAGTTYVIRVVNQSVNSTRPGSVSTLLGVQTFNYNKTNEVGGAVPTLPDAAANSGSQTLQALTTSTAAVQSASPVNTPAANATSVAAPGVDFGFNFSTVVNTNNTGQGSLRQFIINSNALTNENLAQTSPLNGVTLTPGVENAIFMMNDGRTNGTAPAGLRLSMTAPTGYNASTGFTITPTSAFDDITDDYTSIDGSLQEALTGNKVAAATGTSTGAEVTVNFNNQRGFFVTGNSTRIAALSLNNAQGTGVSRTNQVLSDGAAVTFSGANTSGSVVTGVTTLNSATAGVRLQSGATEVTVSNNILRTGRTTASSGTLFPYDGAGIALSDASNNTISGNTISNNNGYGIVLAATTGTNNDNTISGNTINNNGAGPVTTDIAGLSIQNGSGNIIRANTIYSNSGDGIVALAGTSANQFTQNSTYSNGDMGIDLSASAAAIGDGMSKNATTKSANSGANSLLNFPIITQAVVTNTTNGNLQITGYAPVGSTVELFLSDKTVAGFGQGQIYLTSVVEGATSGIVDGDNKVSNYSGVINGFDQGSETGASRFLFTIPLTSLGTSQRSALISTSTPARLTATATIDGTTTSEFSSNILVKLNTPLPVQLVSFTAKATGQDAQLVWRTAQELRNDYFVVERSLDGKSFNSVGQVKGQGSTTTATSYQFTDVQVAPLAAGQPVYYRLRQVDTDGTNSLSAVQVTSFGKASAALSLSPNPASTSSMLDLGGLAAGNYQVSVHDVTGRLVHQASAKGGLAHELPVRQWPMGVYLIQVKGQATVHTARLIKE